MPKLAPDETVTRRTRSSAASRDAAITRASVDAGSAARNATAASIRSRPSADSMMRTTADPDALSGVVTAHLGSLCTDGSS
jgi:hypothetical protein